MADKIEMERYGQCWVRILAEHKDRLELDGLLSPGLFQPGFRLNPKGEYYETTMQSGFPAKAEALGYVFTGKFIK